MGRQVSVGNPPIAVKLRRSAQARRLSLRVSRLDGRVSLTVPPRASEREAMAFLTERESWLRGHLQDVDEPVTVTVGTTLPFRGTELTVAHGGTSRVTLDGDCLCVPQHKPNVAQQVRAFLKVEARNELASRSDHHAARLQQDYCKLTLRDTRSRWGSCTSARGLMYSWRLIMAPPAVLDYVAAHEVAHLMEMNHSDAFWTLVAGLVPDYAAHRRWLRENGNILHRFQFD